MKKYDVPQEQIDAIIDAYVNKQYGMEKIVKKLHLPFGQGVVKRILKENNIHIRSLQEASKIVGLNKKLIVPQELQDQIIQLYKEGYGLDKIVNELQLTFSFDKVRNILIENGIHIRNIKESAAVKNMPDLRKYPINDDYCLVTHNGAWLLGFIAADGYLPLTKGAKNKIIIGLARKDEEILYIIAKEIEFNGPINQYYSNEINGKTYPCSSLSFTSKKLREKIEEYGIKSDKTFNLKFLPSLPKEYMIDFIRGYFDGDGSVYKPQDKCINMSIISANRSFLENMNYFLINEYNIEGIINADKKYWQLHWNVKNSIILGKLLYDNNYIALPRKKQKFFELIS